MDEFIYDLADDSSSALVLAADKRLGGAVGSWLYSHRAIFRSHGWWTIAADVSGVLGLLVVGVFVLSQRTLEIGFQDRGVQINLWMHLIGAIAVIVLARLPALQTWAAEAP